METLLAILIAVGLLYLWVRDRTKEISAKTEERQLRCPHPPESQRTIRVNSILTLNPGMLHRIVPGHRWLAKHCDVCGKQRMMYRPTLQPWDEYEREYNQETIDREAQYNARKAAHTLEERNRRERIERERERDSDRS